MVSSPLGPIRYTILIQYSKDVCSEDLRFVRNISNLLSEQLPEPGEGAPTERKGSGNLLKPSNSDSLLAFVRRASNASNASKEGTEEDGVGSKGMNMFISTFYKKFNRAYTLNGMTRSGHLKYERKLFSMIE